MSREKQRLSRIQTIPFVAVASVYILGWIVSLAGLACLQKDVDSKTFGAYKLASGNYGVYALDWFLLFWSLLWTSAFLLTEHLRIQGWRRLVGGFTLISAVLYTFVASTYVPRSDLSANASVYTAGIVVQTFALYGVLLLVYIEAENVLYRKLFQVPEEEPDCISSQPDGENIPSIEATSKSQQV